NDEYEIGHIRLARDTDLVVVAPATADLLAKMANGLATDLASTVLLASDKPIIAAPAMNPAMWTHPATARNVEQLKADGVTFIGPEAGEMAERNEAGVGRMSEPDMLAEAIISRLRGGGEALSGMSAVVTAGPTHEPIDPVRYIANRSSGKQGYAIARALADHGASVTLISGPTTLPTPVGVTRIDVETTIQMQSAVKGALPADIAVMTAAVADWRTEIEAGEKIKKTVGDAAPTLTLTENPDILAGVSALSPHERPKLVVGFAAETEKIVEYATAKRLRKGCDWIIANDVSPETGVMGGDQNTVHLITENGSEDWPKATKSEVAEKLAARIAQTLGQGSKSE
ncbi:MAG: bifunctional phosphopantothenoylcysteine decarboxylase/phosphopantothenate--cysteine ligase CoaBC, partial [Pseudomonadota bacterium]